MKGLYITVSSRDGTPVQELRAFKDENRSQILLRFHIREKFSYSLRRMSRDEVLITLYGQNSECDITLTVPHMSLYAYVRQESDSFVIICELRDWSEYRLVREENYEASGLPSSMVIEL